MKSKCMKILLIFFIVILVSPTLAVNETLTSLSMSNDTADINNIMNIINQYEFTVTYGPHFVCREFTAALWQFLNKTGYKAYIICYYGGETPENATWGHSYIVVKMKHGWLPIEPTGANDLVIGYIPTDLTGGKIKYLVDCVIINTSDELYTYDLQSPESKSPFYTGDLTRFIKTRGY